jgi:hypothetical protein
MSAVSKDMQSRFGPLSLSVMGDMCDAKGLFGMSEDSEGYEKSM